MQKFGPCIGLAAGWLLTSWVSPLAAEVVGNDRVAGEVWVELEEPLQFEPTERDLTSDLLAVVSHPKAGPSDPHPSGWSAFDVEVWGDASAWDAETLLDLTPARAVVAKVVRDRPASVTPPIKLAEPSSLFLLAGLGGIGLVWQLWRRNRQRPSEH